jgi:superfamily II helicase
MEWKNIKMTKTCSKCKQEKDISQFNKNKRNKDGFQYFCKKCKLEQDRKYYVTEKFHLKNLKQRMRQFGKTIEDYNILFEKQHGCCAICGKHQSEFNNRFMIDHNHITGQIRGLLCRNCNCGIGLFYSDERGTELLKKSIKYIEETENG